MSAALNASSRNLSGPFNIVVCLSSLFRDFTLNLGIFEYSSWNIFKTCWYQRSRVSRSAHSRSRIPFFCFVCKKVLSDCSHREIGPTFFYIKIGWKFFLIFFESFIQFFSPRNRTHLVEYDGEADRWIQLGCGKNFHLQYTCK